MIIGSLGRIMHKPLYFYHLVPKGSDISIGLLSPYAMIKLGYEDLASKSLNKYRDRLVNEWGYYKNRTGDSLTNEEIMNGLDKYREVKNSSRTIYFFKYPPYKELGLNMKSILDYKDIYRIDLNNVELQKYIEFIDWGHNMSHKDNMSLSKQWYQTISEKDYFAAYDDNPHNKPLFASLNHIGVVFKDGICPSKFLERCV